MGDPVLGPGALDALEHGCAVVQVKYPRPRVERWVNPRLPWRTQHDFVDEWGRPGSRASLFKEYPDAVRRAPTCRANRRGAASPPATGRGALRRVEGWPGGAGSFVCC